MMNLLDQDHRKAQLRRVLDVIFPVSYVKKYHQPPQSVCSLIQFKCASKCQPNKLTETGKDCPKDDVCCKVSSEPASRIAIRNLHNQLNASLQEHQAKPAGLCPVRRAIYDQCLGRLARLSSEISTKL